MVNLADKKILVTGATGFIAGRLVERLHVECGANVRALVHRWENAAWLARLPIELMQGDVADPAAIRRAVEGCDIVFHCASGGSDLPSYRAVNVEGTRVLMDAAVAAKVSRVVYVSSFVVHGLETSGSLDESMPLVSCGRAYADSKIEAEIMLQQYFGNVAPTVAIIRPTLVWGPRGGQYTVGPVSAMKRGKFSWIDDGKPECPAVQVDNLVDALLLAATRPEAAGQAFLIADGEGYSWRQYFDGYARMLALNHFRNINSTSGWIRAACRFYDRLEKLMNRLAYNPAPIYIRLIRRSAREIRGLMEKLGITSCFYLQLYSRPGGVSIEKARRLLGYQPRVTLAEGMQQAELWLRDQQPGLFESESGK